MQLSQASLYNPRFNRRCAIRVKIPFLQWKFCVEMLAGVDGLLLWEAAMREPCLAPFFSRRADFHFVRHKAQLRPLYAQWVRSAWLAVWCIVTAAGCGTGRSDRRATQRPLEESSASELGRWLVAAKTPSNRSAARARLRRTACRLPQNTQHGRGSVWLTYEKFNQLHRVSHTHNF